METRPGLCRAHHDPRVKMLARYNLHQDGGDPRMPVASVPCVLMSSCGCGDHSLWAPPWPHKCLVFTGHRLWGSPPRVITAQADHSSYSHPTLVTLHCRHSANATHFLPRPSSCPPPSLLSSSTAHTTLTMPIDPIQSHHPLPFKYFSVTQLNYCYLSPDLGTRYSSLALGCLSRCICMSGTRASVTAIAVTQPQMQRSHSSHAVWFSTNSQAVNSFQYSRV